MVMLSPSILSADLMRLEEEIKKVEDLSDSIHVDVMDGVFVPNISFGMPLVKALRKTTNLPLDVHLMIIDPDRYIDTFAELGADSIWVHVETCAHLHRTVENIKKNGKQAFVCLNPATPLSTLDEILPYVDGVLLMTVNPGFGGQKFIPTMKEKVRRLKRRISEDGLNVQIAVDGGIGESNAEEIVKAGADLLIMGSSVFSAKDPREVLIRLRKLFSRE